MNVSAILGKIASTGKSLENADPGAREALIAQSRALIAALELPSEFIQRTFWAEVSHSILNDHLLFLTQSQARPIRNPPASS